MKKSMLLVFYLLISGAFSVEASLFDRGGGLIYDDILNVTWLQDANYAKTSGYDGDGRMEWQEAINWAENLVYDGYSDWRLPDTADLVYRYGYDGTTSAGFNITSSEMGHMFYGNLGGIPYRTSDTQTNNPYGFSDMGPFFNLQKSPYWSGTEYLSHAYDYRAWVFNFNDGSQGYQQYSVLEGQDPPAAGYAAFYAWAVRDGDVASVPIPGAVWLLGAGIIGMIGLKRKFLL